MEEPYVLTKLPKSTSTSSSNIYVGKTYVGTSISGREVVTAIDAQGVNIYNIKANQVALSYSLSPSTNFHCDPVSRLDRATLIRHTYAALQNGQDDMKLHCWIETSTDGDTKMTSCALAGRVLGVYLLIDSVLLLFADGRLQRLAPDLSTVLEEIESKAYAEDSDVQFTVVAHRLLESPITDQSIQFRILTRSAALMHMYHFRMASTSDPGRIGETTFYGRKFHTSVQCHAGSQNKICIGAQGQVAISIPTSNHTDIFLYNSQNEESGTIRLAHPDALHAKSALSLQWLNNDHILLTAGKSFRILDALYSTCQASRSFDRPHSLLAVIPQKKMRSAGTDRAILVLANDSDLCLSGTTFSEEMSLLGALGKRESGKKASDIWYQDVSMQSTWKDSIPAITAEAKNCLTAIQAAEDGSRIDSLLENFLFPAVQGGAPSKQHINGNSEGCPVNGHTNGVSPGERTFRSYQSDVSLSVMFISKFLHFVFKVIPKRHEFVGFPEASIDFLLRKGLISTSALESAGVNLTEIIAVQPGLRLRVITDVSGLNPLHLFSILQSYLVEDQNLESAVPAIMTRLDRYDDLLVTEAARNSLSQNNIEALLKLLHVELTRRLEVVATITPTAFSDEVLCGSITRLLDTFGISNLAFSSETRELIKALRPVIAQLLAQTESVASTSSSISELLMKARLLETTSKSKVLAIEKQSSKENPEPEARRSGMPLDKVKKREKNQSSRAKAFARVQGIGGLYTIETLQI